MISFPSEPPADTSFFQPPEPAVLTFCGKCGQSMPSGYAAAILDHEGKRITDPWVKVGSFWLLPQPKAELHTWIAEGRMFGTLFGDPLRF
jgi:hypothetical protein